MSTREQEYTTRVQIARCAFAELMTKYFPEGAARDAYIRYLQFQYHLTCGVQEYFLAIAASSRLRPYRRLRAFLVDFAYEEEKHYLLAGKDLAALGASPGEEPLDVALWHAYFRPVTRFRPFERLGAALILESIAGGQAAASVSKALSAPFLSRENTRFLVLHRHEAIPHGEQVMDAILSANLSAEDHRSVIRGAAVGTTLYMRMATWAADPTAFCCDIPALLVEGSKRREEEIAAFDPLELAAEEAWLPA